MTVLTHPRGKDSCPLNPICAMPSGQGGSWVPYKPESGTWKWIQQHSIEGLCRHIEPSPAPHKYTKAQSMHRESVSWRLWSCCLYSRSPLAPLQAQIIPSSSGGSFRTRALSPCPLTFLGYFGSLCWLVIGFEQCECLVEHTGLKDMSF